MQRHMHRCYTCVILANTQSNDMSALLLTCVLKEKNKKNIQLYIIITTE